MDNEFGKKRYLTLPRIHRLMNQKAMKAWCQMESSDKSDRDFNSGLWIGFDLSRRLIGMLLENGYSKKSNWKIYGGPHNGS